MKFWITLVKSYNQKRNIIPRGEICNGEAHLDIVEITTKDEIPEKV